MNPDGHLIGDAILFHLEEELFDLVGHPMVLDWVTFNLERGDYEATVERDDNSAVRTSGPPKLYRYELQGPTAAALIEEVTGAPLPDVKFFNMAEFTIAGRRVRGLRHGMAGQPGFELFGPWEDGDAVLDALLRAGENHGLVRVGAKAYSTANLESGWVPAPMTALFSDDPLMQEYREWLPVDEGRLHRRQPRLGRHPRLLPHPVRHRVRQDGQVRPRVHRPRGARAAGRGRRRARR